MNSYTKLVEIIGQKRAVIDRLTAELAPLDDVLKALEKDYDEISLLRLQVRELKRVDALLPAQAPESEAPALPAPEPAASAPSRMPNKQQQIFDALVEPMSISQIRAKLPSIKSVDSLIKVLRLKGAVTLDKTDLRYHRASGVTDVPKTLPGTTA